MTNRIILSAGIMLITLVAYYFVAVDASVVSMVHRLFASIFVLFLPGYWISLTFFDVDELHRFERGVMSLVVSLAVVPFALIISKLLSSDISVAGGYLLTSCIILVFGLVVVIKNSRH